MGDHATPNLPTREMATTVAFYGALGFVPTFRDEGWLILARDGIELEFFPHPDLDPATSAFSCCLHLDDLDAFYRRCLTAEIPESTRGFPRLHAPRQESSGLRIGYLLDPDGSLLRLIQNPTA